MLLDIDGGEEGMAREDGKGRELRKEELERKRRNSILTWISLTSSKVVFD